MVRDIRKDYPRTRITFAWCIRPCFAVLCCGWIQGNVTNILQEYFTRSGKIIDEHDDAIKRQHFPRYWPFVRGIHRLPVDYPSKGQWRGALVFSLTCAWTNGGANTRDAGDLRRHRVNYDVTVMDCSSGNEVNLANMVLIKPLGTPHVTKAKFSTTKQCRYLWETLQRINIYISLYYLMIWF